MRFFLAPRAFQQIPYLFVCLFFLRCSHYFYHSTNRDLSLSSTAITITAPTAFLNLFVHSRFGSSTSDIRTHLFGRGSQHLVPQMYQSSWIQAKTAYCTAVITSLLTLTASNFLRMFSICLWGLSMRIRQLEGSRRIQTTGHGEDHPHQGPHQS